MPEISVLMPCYNAAETLDEALGSLARQTFSDFEIIALDDGSQDATLERLHAWQAHEPRLRAVGIPHAGIIAALNAGLEVCQGALIARMDADDRCHPARLEKQRAYLQAHPGIDVLGCQVAAFPEDEVHEGLRLYLEWQNALLTDEEIRLNLFIESPLTHPSVMLRKEGLVEAGGYEEHGWAEDYDLWLRLALAGKRFAKVPEVLLDWRETPQRLTRCDRRYSLENFIRAKAHYLVAGPLQGRGAILIWGAGMIGRRLGRLLLHDDAPVVAYLDIDPAKIGRKRHGKPILDAVQLPLQWAELANPIVLVAVGARGARQIIRDRLSGWGLVEGQDWLGVT